MGVERLIFDQGDLLLRIWQLMRPRQPPPSTRREVVVAKCRAGSWVEARVGSIAAEGAQLFEVVSASPYAGESYQRLLPH